jgi:hypothetical protein
MRFSLRTLLVMIGVVGFEIALMANAARNSPPNIPDQVWLAFWMIIIMLFNGSIIAFWLIMKQMLKKPPGEDGCLFTLLVCLFLVCLIHCILFLSLLMLVSLCGLIFRSH